MDDLDALGQAAAVRSGAVSPAELLEVAIARAEAAVEAARDRLIDTVQDIAQQLEPRRLIGELWEDAKNKGADLAEEAVDAVMARPLAATGVVAAIAMFLAREPIADGRMRIAD